MSVISKYNKGRKFNVNIEGMPFKKLKDIYQEGKEFKIKGVALFNTKYGDSAVAILDDCLINLPSHMNADVNDMLHNDEFCEAVNAGKIGFTIRTYEDTKHGKGLCYGVEWTEE